MVDDPTNPTPRADDALDAAGRSMRQAQARLTTLLSAARLAAAVRSRRVAAPLGPSTAR